jgi:hypothetical protein
VSLPRFPQKSASPYPQPSNLKLAEAEGFRVMRSAHATQDRVYPRAVPYVFDSRGARIVAGVDASAGAVSALRRHAEAAERPEAEQITKRRRAA